MSERCIDMSLIAFPELKVLDKGKISKAFLDNVSTNQKWNLQPQITDKLIQKISTTPQAVNNTAQISRQY